MVNRKVLSFIIVCICFAVNTGYATSHKKDSVLKKKALKAAYHQLDSIPIPISDAHSQSPGRVQELLRKNEISPLAISLNRIHNSYIQSYIDQYTSPKYHQHLSEMLARSQYYFPIFERIFKELDIPREIKYLAVVESSLNPNAVSRVGATGPWQFMYATAKGYGLQINSYIDERKDPIAASYAAAEYLQEAYDMYQDWYLAIASYNCGPGNVNRAIRKTGKSKPSFWDIRPFLPRETRNYVPSFIALYKVLSNAETHGIYPDNSVLGNMETEIVRVERSVNLSVIAKTINVSIDDLKSLNPAYKKNIVQGSKNHPARIILPKVPKEFYAGLYQVLQGTKVSKPTLLAENIKSTAPAARQPKKPKSYINYRVQEGDTLEKISKQFKGNSVSSLKALNRIEDDMIIMPGTTLKINWD